MARYRIILAYDGTDFRGFQRQVGVRTVQGVLEEALRKLNWHGVSILAAGRTDSGVHASGQVIAIDLEWGRTPQALQSALNALLPKDISARRVHEVDGTFHPRYDAVARCYQYRIYCEEARDPLTERYAWRIWPAMDKNAVQKAADYLPGTHDFVAFGSSFKPSGQTTRTVYQAKWLQDGDVLTFEITANAFLYHMVRRLVAFLVQIGQGVLTVEAIVSHLGGRDPVKGLAPPHGLCLKEVSYLYNS